MFLGETPPETLTANVMPQNATNRNVTWSSSNPAVATVSNTGVVTAVSAGSTTIIATTVDGSHTATCSVEVIERPVTGVTLGGNTLFILGETTPQTFTATVSPVNAFNQNVTWTSSNPNVATVNTNGMVTAVALGTTNLSFG